VSDLLIAVPNVSEGADAATLDAIGEAFATGGAGVLDVHVDPDHGRSVFTLAGRPGELAGALAAGVREAVERIDLRAHAGRHPHVGAADVVPVVHLDPARRGAACAEALVAAHLVGEEVGVPCFLYGVLAGGRTRADLRRGGVAALARRVLDGELAPDFGPGRIQAGRGATLVAARPPLVAFNLELAPPATQDDARRIAARIRETGPEGLPGLRAIGLALPARGGVAQVSMNVEDHLAVPLARVIEAVAAHADVAEAEVVGLPPAAAFAGYPDRLPTRGRRTLEEALDRAGLR
jgi:glutamate formiminotransferase/glutamate formiminotransferase/formiminotetrahydrofolate cyclodeaminase